MTEAALNLNGIAQAIAHVQESSTSENRDALLTLADGRTFIYSDNDQEYGEIERFVKFEGSVSTIESFAELVVEYAKRFESKKAVGAPVTKGPTGKNQTVTFTSNGATYSPDDEDRRHQFTYRRVLSQQWVALTAILGKPLSHKELIRALQTLKPSITNYDVIISAFRRLTVSKDVKLVSEPVLNESGDSANGYNVQLSVKGGTSETTLPSELDAYLPFARGSQASYIVPIDVDLSERDGVPIITLYAQTLPAIADQAVLDEMKFFDEQMEATGLKDLLTVVNF
jgi:hypothetical protein